MKHPTSSTDVGTTTNPDIPMSSYNQGMMMAQPQSSLYVGSTQVPFLMCTLEIPQKIAAQVLALNFCYLVYF